MKIVRFGCLREEGVADVLEGKLSAGFKASGSTARMVKLPAPPGPSALLCIGLNYHRCLEGHYAVETSGRDYDDP